MPLTIHTGSGPLRWPFVESGMRCRVGVVLFIVTFLFVQVAGCESEEHRPVNGGASQATSDGSKVGTTERPADDKVVAVTPLAFHDEFHADEEATKAKYAGATLEMTAKVQSVGLSGGGIGPPIVLLKAEPLPGETTSTRFVICKTADPKPWLKVGPGGTVTVRGMLVKDAYLPMLELCEIVSFEGDVCHEVSAEGLAREYASDKSEKKEDFHAKYDTRHLVLTGVVESRYTEINPGIVVKGTEGIKLAFTYGSAYEDNYINLKPGDSLQGIFSVLMFREKDANTIHLGLESPLR